MAKRFDKPLPRETLDLDNKIRSNVFTWRGQFSPQLIENLIEAYCFDNSLILDPFCGSGTVLSEAGNYGLEAVGLEINPPAYILSKTYELINLPKRGREGLLNTFLKKTREIFPQSGILTFNAQEAISPPIFAEGISELREEFSNKEALLLDAFVILLDIHNNEITPINIDSALNRLLAAVKQFPYSSKTIKAVLGDARSLPVDRASVDFVVTSPPYINVFNYHQNYRKSAELLGWDLLKIARSEIGSNRANRGNRFLTAVQYCLDMALTLKELHRVCRSQARVILVVGHESTVLGVPFFNANIIASLATESALFRLTLRQDRHFKNKFGKMIREDLLHLEKTNGGVSEYDFTDLTRDVASKVLENGLSMVHTKNRPALLKAIELVPTIEGTPVCDIDDGSYYKNNEHDAAIGA